MLGAYWHKNVYIITLLIEQSVQKCYKYNTSSGVLGGIRGYTAYTNLRVFLTAYTHLSDHK